MLPSASIPTAPPNSWTISPPSRRTAARTSRCFPASGNYAPTSPPTTPPTSPSPKQPAPSSIPATRNCEKAIAHKLWCSPTRDLLAILQHSAQIKLDRTLDQLAHFFLRLPSRDTPRQIGHISP